MSQKLNWSELSESGYEALRRGNFDEAERCFRIVVACSGLNENDERLAYSFLVLGRCCSQRGDYPAAEPHYRKALSIYEKIHREDHRDVALCLAGLAKCNQHQLKFKEAELLYVRVIDMYEKLNGTQDEEVAAMLEHLGQCYVSQREWARAIPCYERSVGIFESERGPYHHIVASNLYALARCYDETHDDKKAEPLFRRALEIFERAPEPDSDQIAHIRHSLGRCYHGMRDFNKAELWYRRALELLERSTSTQMERHVAYCSFGLATCYLSSGDYRAEPAFKRCQSIYEKTFGADDLHMAYFFEAYARLLQNTCRPDEAARLERRAQAIRSAVLDRRRA